MHPPMSLKANAKLIRPCFLEMVTKISIPTKAVGSTAEWPGMFLPIFLRISLQKEVSLSNIATTVFCLNSADGHQTSSYQSHFPKVKSVIKTTLMTL